jgi:hypothetical protein
VSEERKPQGFAETAKYVVGIQGGFADHLKHRLDPKIIGKEICNHLTDKVIPQGADEAANLIFNHSAYLPWPGQGGPKPINASPAAAPGLESPTPEPPLDGTILPPEPPPGGHGVHGSLEGPIIDHAPDHPAVDGPQPGGNALSYSQMLTDAASRGGNEPDQGRTR